MGNTCTYCEDLGDKVSKRIATNTNFRCPVYHSRCRWSQMNRYIFNSTCIRTNQISEDIRYSAVLTERIRRQRRNTITIVQQRS